MIIYLENSLSSMGSTPSLFKLEKPYPNPFNNNISIPIFSHVKSSASIDVFDLVGRKVHTIYEGALQPGTTHFLWDAKIAANGIYVIRSIVNGKKHYDKIMLLK